MKPELKRISTSDELEQIRSLYENSFPEEERREFEDLEHLLEIENFFAFQIITEIKGYAGFCLCWNFQEFLFLEHFATLPELRGLGIGEKTLRNLKELFPVTIILETEPPVNEIATRRVMFYQRNGFRMLNRFYLQPSYGCNKPEVPLKLMFSGDEPDSEMLNRYINQIREIVYRAR